MASEVALALVVLCGAGLMIKSMTRLLGVNPGLNPKNVLTMGMSVPQEEIYVGPPGLPRFCQDLDEPAGAIPGDPRATAGRQLQIPILKGREFTPRDTVAAPGVIVINETMARAYWPKEDPVGQAIRLGGSDGPRLTVVGVVGDVRYLGRCRPHDQRAGHVHRAC